MTANILDGKAVAIQYKQQLRQTITQQAQNKRKPGLAVVLVGDDPASTIYVNHKRKACDELELHSEVHHLAQNTSEETLLALIHRLNQASHIDGILVQLPLPKHISQQTIIESIHPSKDVDGFHPYNMGRLAQGHPLLRPCTPYGIMTLLQHYNIPLVGKNALIIGASNIVGRPMALELLHAKATPTICHSKTQALKEHVIAADIVIVATGRQNVIDTDWLQPHQVVVDVGMHRLDNGTLRGDVDFHTAKSKVAWLTPVPFGVGPMTICMLLKNTLQAYTTHG